MASLSITNTFVSGNVITAAGHNQNWTDVITWANGNIGADNFDTMTETVVWNLSTNALGIQSTNTGTEGSASFAHNGTLASTKSALKVTSNAAQSAGTAIVEITTSSASSNIPALKITDAGTASPAFQVVSTTKPSHPFPSMTTTQRNALTSMAAGDMIYNSTLKRTEMYDGTNWVDGNGQTGTIVAFAGPEANLPAYMLMCRGGTVSRTTYAALFAKIGETWGEGDNSTTFHLPYLSGYFLRGINDGGGTDPDAASRTALHTGGATGDNVGSYQTHAMYQHQHSHSLGTNTTGDHTHTYDGGNAIGVTLGPNGILVGGNSPSTSSAGSHSHSITGSIGNVSGSAASYLSTENRPSNVYVLYAIII